MTEPQCLALPLGPTKRLYMLDIADNSPSWAFPGYSDQRHCGHSNVCALTGVLTKARLFHDVTQV